jgi:hypothetical protein
MLNTSLLPAHIEAGAGCVVTVTGVQVELTVTVTVKGEPTQVPAVGVTV